MDPCRRAQHPGDLQEQYPTGGKRARRNRKPRSQHLAASLAAPDTNCRRLRRPELSWTGARQGLLWRDALLSLREVVSRIATQLTCGEWESVPARRCCSSCTCPTVSPVCFAITLTSTCPGAFGRYNACSRSQILMRSCGSFIGDACDSSSLSRSAARSSAACCTFRRCSSPPPKAEYRGSGGNREDNFPPSRVRTRLR
jgi:hypothetical protein